MSQRHVQLLVLGVWLALTAVTLRVVAHYSDNTPTWDEWVMVPVATGNQPVTPSWLWSQHTQHRIPLPKMLLVCSYRLSGCNFKTMAYINVLLLSGMSLALIVTASRMRGHWAVADAFFPLSFLQWAQMENLVWGFQIQFVASVVLSCIALIGVLQRSPRLAAVCAFLLPLCGSNGLFMAPAILVWVFYEAFRQRSWFAVFLGTAGVAASALYLVGFHSGMTWHIPFVLSLVQAEAELLGLSFQGGNLLGAGVVIACLVPLLVTVVHWFRRQKNRIGALIQIGCVLIITCAILACIQALWGTKLRWWTEWQVVGMFVLLLALFALAQRRTAPIILASLVLLSALSVGHSGSLTSRYITLWLPLWAAIYLALRDPVARAAVCAAALLLFISSVPFGLQYAKTKHEMCQGFLEAVQNKPLEQVAMEYTDGSRQTLAARGPWYPLFVAMQTLQRAGHPSFQGDRVYCQK